MFDALEKEFGKARPTGEKNAGCVDFRKGGLCGQMEKAEREHAVFGFGGDAIDEPARGAAAWPNRCGVRWEILPRVEN